MKQAFLLFCLILNYTVGTSQPFVDTNYGFQQLPTVIYGQAIDFAGTNRSLSMNIFLPVGDTIPSCGRPLLVIVHGGGFISGSKSEITPTRWAQGFAKRGYVTASIDYRLGYFNPSADIHCNVPNWDCINAADTAEWYRAVYRAMQDTKGAIRFLVNNASQYHIDARNVFLVGESAGAITALNTAFMDVPGEKHSSCFAISDASTPHVRYEAACIQANSLATNVQSMNTTRPDLGPVEGDLNLPTAGYRLKGIGSFYGGFLSNLLVNTSYTQSPALYLFHQPNDLLVPYGRDRIYEGVSTCAMQVGNCQAVVNRPFIDGSQAIKNIVAGMPSTPLKPLVYFDTTTNTADCLTQIFNPSTTGHGIDNYDLRTQHMASFFADKIDTTGNCNLQISDHLFPSNPFLIAPNPANNYTTLSRLSGNESVMLMDVQGRVWQNYKVTKTQHSIKIDLLELPNGIYMIKIISANGGNSVIKLVKD